MAEHYVNEHFPVEWGEVEMERVKWENTYRFFIHFTSLNAMKYFRRDLDMLIAEVELAQDAAEAQASQ